MESPRRYPRTLQEAFGPHTSRDLHTKPPRASLRAWAAYLLILAIALVCAALSGCTRLQETPAGFKPVDPSVPHTGPDEFGVVCYAYGYQTLSCIKVK
jgi:hypothetical protein